MALFSLQNCSYAAADIMLLQEASLHVEEGERVCLVGRNGAGKSTLLRIIAQAIKPDTGLVTFTPGLHFGHMPQEAPNLPGTVYSVIQNKTDNENDTVQEENWDLHGSILSACNHLRLDPERTFATLSGGVQRRVLLARALVSSPHLLLDEPTNHLDIDAIAWLEDFLLRHCRTLFFVTHDRSFAQRLATRFLELDRGNLYSYPGNFSDFLEQKAKRLEIEVRANHNFDKKLAEEEAWIRQGIKARRTRNMGRVRALQDLRKEHRARREKEGNVILSTQEAEKSGKVVIEAKNLCFAHNSANSTLNNFNLTIHRGDKIGLIGPNGSGKTTLLRLLLKEMEPHSGTIRHGTNISLAYYDQMRVQLDESASVMDNVAHGAEFIDIDGTRRHVASWLQNFLFDSSKLRVPVCVLSGGERNRLVLAKLFAQSSNVLVLDEPTNDLDIDTLELLEELLGTYSGTVLLVSHDRTFLDNIVTSTLAFDDDGTINEYVGGYSDWLWQRPKKERASKPEKIVSTHKENVHKKENTDKEEHVDAKKYADEKNASTKNSIQPKKRLSYNEQREKEVLEKELTQLPNKFEQLEQKEKNLQGKMADQNLYNSAPEEFNSIIKRLEAVENEQVHLLERNEFIEKRLKELLIS